MKCTMIAVVSTNGKITRSTGSGQARSENDLHSWTSREDQEFFASQISKAALIVMGSATYETVRNQIKHVPGRIRIVMTTNAEKYQNEAVAGALEFTSEKPSELISRLEEKYHEMLLVGGSEIYTAFFVAGLVDEIYLTVEPIVFGNGKNLFADEEFETRLKLVSIKKLNARGTLLLKYKIEK